jgi:hypothetical protein
MKIVPHERRGREEEGGYPNARIKDPEKESTSPERGP